jgi:4-diphosphocytidyl-2C-methyl-D-erythritol kinase
LVPPFDCPTAEVYRNWQGPLRSADNDANIPVATILPGRDSGACRFVNDLEAAAERVRPQLADLRAMVADEGFPSVGMSGSGSTLFLAFPDARACKAARERLLALELRGVRLLATRSAGAPAMPVSRPWPGARFGADLS